MKITNNWLDKPCSCDSCGDTYKIGYLIATTDGENICEECFDVIKIAETDEKKEHTTEEKQHEKNNQKNR